MPGQISSKELEIRKEIIRRFSDHEFLTAAIKGAAKNAIRKHKLASNPIASWKDGKVIIIQPEDIVLDDEVA